MVSSFSPSLAAIPAPSPIAEAELMSWAAEAEPRTRDTKLSMVEELGMFIEMVLLNLYENNVEGLGPEPHRRGVANVATASPWARTGPLQWHNAETKTKPPSSQSNSCLYTAGWHNWVNGTYSLITRINDTYSLITRING
jgi:hypothetical protein